MLEKLRGDIKKAKASSGGRQGEENLWGVDGDKAGNGSAVIRFLPGLTDDDDVFVKQYKHGFKGNTGKWFVAECPTTIGEECACCDANSELWNTGDKVKQDIVRNRKRKLSYFANILIISDPANPDNEGKVKIFKFGAKIMGKIEAAMNPEFEEDAPINPFDLDEGANFRLRMSQVAGFANFDKSSFAEPTSVGTAAFQANLKKELHDIKKFVDPSLFLSKGEMQRKLDFVNGKSDRRVQETTADGDDEDSKFAKLAASAKVRTKTTPEDDVPPQRTSKPTPEDDDAMMDEFRRLAEED